MKHRPTVSTLARRSALVAAIALTAAACGSDPAPISTPAGADTETIDDPAPADESAPVGVGATDLGQVLIDSAGLTLYGFTEDADGLPTCEGGCADAWPPVIVDRTTVPDGLDPAVFSVVARPDGSLQLKAGDWPLYRFAGDTTAGQTNGHTSGDVWFASAPDGSLLATDAAPLTTSQAAPEQSAFDDGY